MYLKLCCLCGVHFFIRQQISQFCLNIIHLSLCAVAERPQHMLMRVSVGIHGEDIEAAIEVCLCKYLSSFNIFSDSYIL